MTSVILHPVNSEVYKNQNLEPQLVTEKVPHRAILYMDSQDCTLQLNKVDIIMSTVKRVGESYSTLAYNISRISVSSVGINYIIPNINERNNTITFFSSASATFHTVSIPEGFYTNATNIINAIVTALNTATGSSGLTFSQTAVTGFPTTFNLNSAGGNYYFDLSCSAIVKGYQLFCLPTNQTPTNTKKVGAISGWYTRYIDICSDTIVQYAKIKTLTTGKANNLVIRLFVDDPTTPHVIGFFSGGRFDTQEISYNFLPTVPINYVKFILRDQFGDQLYVPPGADGTNGGFFWDCNLIIEN